jgi:hypothetical protein
MIVVPKSRTRDGIHKYWKLIFKLEKYKRLKKITQFFFLNGDE